MTHVHKGTYADIADEYYDAVRHPTSANFRSASAQILCAWLPLSCSEAACDVGAGDSLLAEVLAQRDCQITEITILDSAPEMLAHSARWAAGGATTVVGDAESMPFAESTFAFVVASLGDAYNTSAFWREVARVLKPGGTAVFTTPSFEWADVFRSKHREPLDCAEFLLRDGSRVLVPSFVLPERRQIDLINQSGLSVRGVYHVLLAALHDEPVSKSSKSPAMFRSSRVTSRYALLHSRG